MNSAIYDEGDERFPNEWVGQTASDPIPSLEDAKSPKAYFYRMFVSRGEDSPGTRAKEAYEESHEHNIEAYRANYPQALHPKDLQTELVTIRKATKPWEDFQMPSEWIEQFEGSSSEPPLKISSGPQVVEELTQADGVEYLEAFHEAGILNLLEYQLILDRIERRLD